MNKIKTADKASILNKKAKSTKVGLKETESNKILTAVGIVINHTLIDSLCYREIIFDDAGFIIIILNGMVSIFFNIQYQSTGVGLLSLLDEIELVRTVCGLYIFMAVWHFLMTVCKIISSSWFFFHNQLRYPYRNSTVKI